MLTPKAQERQVRIRKYFRVETHLQVVKDASWELIVELLHQIKRSCRKGENSLTLRHQMPLGMI